MDDRLVVATENAKERTRVVEEQLRSRKRDSMKYKKSYK